jgi:hypothetical protein
MFIYVRETDALLERRAKRICTDDLIKTHSAYTHIS